MHATITKGNVVFLGVGNTQMEAEGMAVQAAINNLGEGDTYDVICAGEPEAEITVMSEFTVSVDDFMQFITNFEFDLFDVDK